MQKYFLLFTEYENITVENVSGNFPKREKKCPGHYSNQGSSLKLRIFFQLSYPVQIQRTRVTE